MSRPEIIEEKPLTMLEVKSALTKIRKREQDLSFRGNKTEEYITAFATITKKKSEEIYSAIEDLKVPRLKDVHIKKLVDILPRSQDDVKYVLQGFQTLTVSQENSRKIAKAIRDNLE